jgi:hypothetical protein
MAWETAFEKFWAVEESVRGTGIATPTHDLNATGEMMARTSKARGMNFGTLADQHRSAIVRKRGEWSIDEQPANVFLAPWWFNKIFKGGISPVQIGSTGVYLSTFIRDMTSDSIKSFTGIWGDPNVQTWQSNFCVTESFNIKADASSEDPVLWSMNGGCKFPAKVSTPSAPTTLNPPLLIPALTQLFIDTSSAIGTTEITDRLISAELSFDTGVTYKFIAQGAAGDLGYARSGRKVGHPVLKLAFEALDMTQYDLWAAGTTLKVRVIFNGPIISSTYHHSIQFDVYGPLNDDFTFGDLEDSNGTFEVQIDGEYDSTLGSDLNVVVQSNRAAV